MWRNTDDLGSQVLIEISKLKTLKKLIYSSTNPLVTKNDFIAVFNTNNLSSLTLLDFSDCINFEDEGLISAARVCQGLRELRVYRGEIITNEGLLFVISKCKQLHSL